MFSHEKLKVYKKALQFAASRGELIAAIPCRIAARDHLDRGAESILLNIAHASSSKSPKERIVYLGHANGSALECAACMDVFVAKELVESPDVYPLKALLVQIVSMLIAMRKVTANQVREDHTGYRTKHGRMFSHEDLEVYRVSPELVAWLESVQHQFSCSADLLAKLDRATTAITLNIAEGNGRFTATDQAKFLAIAQRSTAQAAALVDIAITSSHGNAKRQGDGRHMLRQIAGMLVSLLKVKSNAP